MKQLPKIVPAGVIVLAACCMAFAAGCSRSKAVSPEATEKPSTKRAFDNALVGKGQDDVRKKLGDPTVVSKTPEDHILWVYIPTWRILPNDKGYLYVEYENGKVIKIFKKK